MRTCFLFWNIKRKDLRGHLAEIVKQHEVDVVLLAESCVQPADMEEALGSSAGYPFAHAPSLFPPCNVQAYTRFDPARIIPEMNENHFLIHRLALPQRGEILLLVCHLSSRLFKDQRDRDVACHTVVKHLLDIEAKCGTSRTLVVGDFNMQPYDDAVIEAQGWHAAMTRSIALREKRTVAGKEYRFFYNPMWSRLGDESVGPAGTYYYDPSKQIQPYWHMFDQVLLRPALLGCFRNQDLSILTHAGVTQLCRKDDRPDAAVGSDHLPLLVSLDL
jgi:hypothetical protein